MYSEPKNDLGKTVWLKFEVTNEVTDEKNRKKSSVFKGFRRQGVKSTASKPPAVLPSSASADLSAGFIKMPPIWAAFCLRSFRAPSQMGRRFAPYKRFGPGAQNLGALRPQARFGAQPPLAAALGAEMAEFTSAEHVKFPGIPRTGCRKSGFTAFSRKITWRKGFVFLQKSHPFHHEKCHFRGACPRK